MSAPDRGACRLCGTAVSETCGDPDGRYCSSGCRAIYEQLGPPREADDPRGGVEASSEETPKTEATDDVGRGRARTFLRIDGMHTPTCEAYLEWVATAQDGVSDVSASYVTETVRIDHDPDRVSATELRDALSRLGYTAYLRDASDPADDTGTAGPRRSREMTGIRKRRTDDMFDARYIAGIIFGAFVLIPYISVLYPVYLASFYDAGMLGMFAEFDPSAGLLFLRVYFVLTGIVLFFTGMPVLRGAYVSLRMRRPTSELLVSLTVIAAYLYGTVAALLGQNEVYYDLTIAVTAIVMAGLFYETGAKRRALSRLTALTSSQVSDATRIDTDGPTTVDVDDLEPGDHVLVREGERVPVDGELAAGECTVDEAVVTGESLPVVKRDGDPVRGGSVVSNGAAEVRVGDGAMSSIDRLTQSVWNLQSADHGIQHRADALAARLIPVVLAAAIVAAVVRVGLGANGGTVTLTVLLAVIAASPWALGLATPISVGSSIESALDRGVVVFDETVFERLRGIDVVVFDKTGTVTAGKMAVIEVDAPPDLLRAAAALERRSSHPAARAIAAAVEDASSPPMADGGDTASGEPVDPAPSVKSFRSHATGVEGRVDDTLILVGHPDLFTAQEWHLSDEITAAVADARDHGRLPIVLGRAGTAEGVVVLGDEPRTDWADTIAGIGDRGIDVVVLTGDDDAGTEFLVDHPQVTRVFAGVPPAGKTAAIRLLTDEENVAMVGDGTNDAPALAAADLGIALGGGTALASDAADLAILDDDLAAIETTFDLAAAARQRVVRNTGLALSYNAIVVPMALAGLLNPLVSMVAVVVCCGLLVGNSSRDLLAA